MISDWNIVIGMYGTWKSFGLDQWALLLVKKDISDNGKCFATIDIRERGTGISAYTQLNPRAHLLAMVCAERFTSYWPNISALNDAELEAWLQLHLYNTNNGIANPMESALLTVLTNRLQNVTDRDRDVS